MIQLIAEHIPEGVTVRGLYNNNLIVSKVCKNALLALMDFNSALFDFEDRDMWKELDFQLTHEYSE